MKPSHSQKDASDNKRSRSRFNNDKKDGHLKSEGRKPVNLCHSQKDARDHTRSHTRIDSEKRGDKPKNDDQNSVKSTHSKKDDSRKNSERPMETRRSHKEISPNRLSCSPINDEKIDNGRGNNKKLVKLGSYPKGTRRHKRSRSRSDDRSHHKRLRLRQNSKHNEGRPGSLQDGKIRRNRSSSYESDGLDKSHRKRYRRRNDN